MQVPPITHARVDRVDVLRQGITPQSRAIEIGPLDNPILPKPAYDAVYLDYTTADALRAKYADDSTRGPIVDIDWLWDGSGPLPPAIAEQGSIDAVVASHVLEHVPDPLGWLGHVANVLRPGGTIALALPDKRFTFDVNRRLTEFSDLLDAHLRRATLPSYAQLFDYHTKAVSVEASLLWDGLADYSDSKRPGDLELEAYNGCVALRAGGPYVDVHCHTFTPTSFVDLFDRASAFGLVDYTIAKLIPTQRSMWEFFVQLERVDPADTSRARADAGIARARLAIANGPVPAVPPDRGLAAVAPPGASWYLVSDRELRLLQVKRSARTAVRRRVRALLDVVRRPENLS